nr:hypothetical protein CFP56_38658 [Quercus suber]
MIEEAYISVSHKINQGYLESMAILFPLRGEIIKHVQEELIQGPNFNKPQAPQAPVSQLKSVKERPKLQGKRKVIVASKLREDEFKLRGEVEAAKQEVEEQARDLVAAKAKKQWLFDQLKALQDTHWDQVGPDVFKFLEKSEIGEKEEEEEEDTE